MFALMFLATGFADNLDTIVSTAILFAAGTTFVDMIKPKKLLKITASFLSLFSMIYALTTPHFNVLGEVYGLALSSEKIADTDPYSVAFLYGIATLVIVSGTGIKFLLIKRVHKKIKTSGGI
jgi:lysylphosphatidylglycerol synthetase-like protein (DUF2156 family)